MARREGSQKCEKRGAQPCVPLSGSLVFRPGISQVRKMGRTFGYSDTGSDETTGRISLALTVGV